jgi:hypothetical protein
LDPRSGDLQERVRDQRPVTEEYLAAHPQNVRAFLAAYREGVDILRKQEDVWLEHGKKLQMTPESIVLLRDEMREDLWTELTPTTEADVRKVFDFLLREAGPQALGGLSELPPRLITTEYQ